MLPFLRNWGAIYSWVLNGLAELAAAIPWMLFAYSILGYRDWPQALPGLWLLLVAYGAGALWEAGDRSEAGKAAAPRVVATVVVLAAVYVLAYLQVPGSMRPGFFNPNAAWAMIPVAGYLWYQGILSVAQGVDYSRLYVRFPWQVGGVLLALFLLIISGGARDQRVAVLLYWSVVLLFVAGLASLLVAREEALRAGQARLGEARQGGGRLHGAVKWLIVALLGLTFAAARIMSVEQLSRGADRVGDLLGQLYQWFMSVILLIVARWVMMLAWIIEPFVRWLLSRPKPPPREEQPGELLLGDPPPDVIGTNEMVPYLQTILIIGVIAFVIWIVYKLSIRPRQRVVPEEEEKESLGFWSNLLDDLKGLGKGRLQAAGAAVAAERLSPRDPRMLYRRLQAWGAATLRARQNSETPNAYGRELGARQPEQLPAVDAVTVLYNQARYGAAPPDPAAVEQGVGAVEQLERAPRRSP